MKNILVTGGAGYVGCVLVPKLLKAGYHVTVYDLMLFGSAGLPDGKTSNDQLTVIEGDIRDIPKLTSALKGIHSVIHLACIANDPSFELNPDLSKSINYTCFEPMVVAAKSSGVKRFIYASTSSVYGVSEAPEVTEEHPLVPVSDYNKYKGLSEPLLLKHQSPDFTTVIIRPATVCGYSPRTRLDLSVNILTNHAVNKRKITVFGGPQKRPNIHVDDISDLYLQLLEMPAELIAGETFNAGYQNHTISDLAELVRKIVEEELPETRPITVETTSSNDLRSYHVSSEKIARKLGFRPKRTIEDAVRDLCKAFKAGKLPNSFEDPSYFNVRMTKNIGLSCKNTRIAIVTGGAGFIGSHTVDLLVSEGFQVRVIDNLVGGREGNLSQHASNPNVSLDTRDIRNIPASDRIYSDVDYVFHFAGIGDIVPSIDKPVDYMSTNVMGTVVALEGARRSGKAKFIYAASSSCYGLAEQVPTTENAPIQPQYPYALSKYQGEQAVFHWSKVYRLPVIAIRIFNAYGLRSRTTGAYGAVFGVFLKQKLSGKPFTVVGDGTQRRDFVYVTDVARAFFMAAESSYVNEIYNLGAGNPQSVNHLVTLLGNGKIEYLDKRPGEPECTWADISKIRSQIGWEQKVSFEEGVAKMVERIQDWNDAPLWDKQSIAQATKGWFAALGEEVGGQQ